MNTTTHNDRLAVCHCDNNAMGWSRVQLEVDYSGPSGGGSQPDQNQIRGGVAALRNRKPTRSNGPVRLWCGETKHHHPTGRKHVGITQRLCVCLSACV